MNKKWAAALLLLPLIFSFSYQHKDNEIPWSASRRLTWSDFKSRPDNSATNAALTSSKIIFNYGYREDKGFTFTINCLFDKTSSWGRVKTEYILAHEQGHFDIAEIYARKLNKALQGYSFKPATVGKDVPALYQQLMQEEAALQHQYDNETDYSRNKPQQAAWLDKIQRSLEKLHDYADYKK
jgi:hypothetical protein